MLNGPRYWRYEPASGEPGVGRVRLPAAGLLTEADWRLASVFDGDRDAAARLAAAQTLKPGCTVAELRRLAERLTAVGALRPGRLEPLPIPDLVPAVTAQLTDTMPVPLLGLTALPATVPGSRAAPGLLGGVSSWRVGTGLRPPIDLPLPAAPFLALGAALLWPFQGPIRRALLWLLLGLALYGIWQARDLWLAGWAAQFRAGDLWWSLPLGALLVNLVSQSARALAVHAETGFRAPVGIAWGRPPVPHFRTDTRGHPEAAPRAARVRMVMASLYGTLSLVTALGWLWLVMHSSAPRLAQAVPVIATLAALSLLPRLNPMARFDGQAGVAQWFGQPDLRYQGLLALFGWARPWPHQTRALGQAALRRWAWAYLLFALVVSVLMIRIFLPPLTERLGGIGFLLFFAVIGVFMYKQLGRPPTSRDTLGWESTWQKLKGWRPSRRQWLIGGGLLILCLIPYRYEPSGDLEILPQQQADVRAGVAGTVREVRVGEGDVVSAGTVLARLSDAQQRAQVAASEAALAQLRADLRLLEAGARDEEVEVARSRLATLSKRAEFSRATEQRLARAYRQGGVSVEEYERARGTAEVDEQARAEAERALELLLSGTREERIAALKAQIEREEALLAFHREELDNTLLKAPIDGRVVSSRLQFGVGQYLERGEVFAVIEDSGVRLAELKLPEAAVGELAVGRPVKLRVWAFPGTSFRGEIRHIAPVAEPGRHGRVVRVQAAVEDPEGRLKSGMTGAGKARGDWHPAIVVFTRALGRFLFVEVWSWLP